MIDGSTKQNHAIDTATAPLFDPTSQLDHPIDLTCTLPPSIFVPNFNYNLSVTPISIPYPYITITSIQTNSLKNNIIEHG